MEITNELKSAVMIERTQSSELHGDHEVEDAHLRTKGLKRLEQQFNARQRLV